MKKILASAFLMLSAAAAIGQANTGGNVPYYNTGGAGVTAAGISAALANQSGCGTLNYAYSPQSGTCIPVGGSAVTFPTGILYGSGSTAAPTQATNTQLSGAVNTAYGYTPLSPTGSGAGLSALNASNLASGTVPAAQMPALTGDCTTSAGAVATTCTKTNGISFGTAATQNTGTSGATIPLLNGTNTQSGPNTYSAAGAASTPALEISGAPYVGTNANSFGQLDIAWSSPAATTALNTAGTAFTIRPPSGFTGDYINLVEPGGTASDFSINASSHVVTANQGGFSTSQTVTGANGVYGRGTSPLNAQATTAATSSTCQAAGAMKFLQNYWNGSASAVNTSGFTPGCTGGTNGAESITVGNISGSTGPFTFSVGGYLTQTVAGAASQPGLWTTGAPYTGGSASTNYPQNYFDSGSTEPTNFNTAGTMVGINGPSGFSGDLFAGWNNGGTKLWSFSTSGTASFNNSLGFGGTLFASSTTAPTMAPGTGAGTSPTCTSVTGNNNTMVVACTTGTSPAASATVATITFSASLSPALKGCSLTPRNAISAIAPNDVYTTAPSSTTFTIAVGTTALSASTAYSWSLICL